MAADLSRIRAGLAGAAASLSGDDYCFWALTHGEALVGVAEAALSLLRGLTSAHDPMDVDERIVALGAALAGLSADG